MKSTPIAAFGALSLAAGFLLANPIPTNASVSAPSPNGQATSEPSPMTSMSPMGSPSPMASPSTNPSR